MEVLKVSSKSNPSLVAGALAAVVRESKQVEIQAIGAGAINQTVKAIAIASSFFKEENKQICCLPTFVEVELAGAKLTAISFIVEEKN